MVLAVLRNKELLQKAAVSGGLVFSLLGVAVALYYLFGGKKRSKSHRRVCSNVSKEVIKKSPEQTPVLALLFESLTRRSLVFKEAKATQFDHFESAERGIDPQQVKRGS